MNARWILIDGYSLMYRQGKLKKRPGDLMMARQRLIRKLEEVAGHLAERMTVVFDGAASRKLKGEQGGEGYESSSVEVLFSPSDKTADTLIERMVHTASDAAGIIVVTSDRLERETASAAGADTMSSGDFLDWCKRTQMELSRQTNQRNQPYFRSRLGDYFPQTRIR